ncbi:MAG TPA: Fic family protein [Candidatus Eisenbacteria bacterium]
MKRSTTGEYVTTAVAGESIRSFIPSPLPPSPPLDLPGELGHRLDRAHIALGRLDGVSGTLPDPHLFLYAYVRKEAVLSSQIEGTQSSLSDLLLFELDEVPGVPFDDVVEVSNYVAALEYGLGRIRAGFPLSNRLICEVHAKLLSRGRGQNKSPGEFRRSQNWIGGFRPGDANFVPPPPQRVDESMAALERFLHDDPVKTPTLLKAALAHVQFETIHPFLDGNGRVGRLLIPMLLCIEGVLREPLLYLSLYLKQNRARYYELLDRVRAEGDWEEWVEFFAIGVEETANGAVATAQRMNDMAQKDRAAIQGIGRVAGSTLQVHHALLARPINTIARISTDAKLSVPAVTSAIAALRELGLVREITGRKRGRVFAYGPYLEVLQQGTERA